MTAPLVSMLASIATGFVMHETPKNKPVFIRQTDAISNPEHILMLDMPYARDPASFFVNKNTWYPDGAAPLTTHGKYTSGIWGTREDFGIGTELNLISDEYPNARGWIRHIYTKSGTPDGGVAIGIYRVELVGCPTLSGYSGIHISRDLTHVVIPSIAELTINQACPIASEKPWVVHANQQAMSENATEDGNKYKFTTVTTKNPSPTRSGPTAIRINGGPIIVVEYDTSNKQFHIPISRSIIDKKKITHYCSLNFNTT